MKQTSVDNVKFYRPSTSTQKSDIVKATTKIGQLSISDYKILH